MVSHFLLFMFVSVLLVLFAVRCAPPSWPVDKKLTACACAEKDWDRCPL